MRQALRSGKSARLQDCVKCAGSDCVAQLFLLSQTITPDSGIRFRVADAISCLSPVTDYVWGDPEVFTGSGIKL